MRMIAQHRNHHKCNSSYGFAPDAFRVWYRLSCGPHKHLGKARENPTNMHATNLTFATTFNFSCVER